MNTSKGLKRITLTEYLSNLVTGRVAELLRVLVPPFVLPVNISLILSTPAMLSRLPTICLAPIRTTIIRWWQRWVPLVPKQSFMEITGRISQPFRAMLLRVYYSENPTTLKTTTTGHFCGEKTKARLLEIPVI